MKTGWPVAAGCVVLLALAVRVAGLGDLRLFGDSASSVYFALRPWTEIAAATAPDSHPPGYYYLLRLSLDLFGRNELAARLPSLFPGVVLVALVLAAGRMLSGPRAALAAGLLAAFSPPLVIYSRQPRMYALLAALGIALLIVAARPRRNVLLVVLSLALLLVHYFAIFVVVAALAVRLARAWPQRRAMLAALVPFVVAGVLSLPWVAYALPAALEHTGRTISGVPPPASVWEWLADLMVFVPVGSFVPLEQSYALAGWMWFIVGILLLSGRPQRSCAALGAGVVLACAVAVYLVAPPFARPRFFLTLVPLAILALAPTIAALPTVMANGLAGLLIFSSALGVYASMPIERGTFELDALRLAEAIQPVAGPDDLVLLQPWWQAGYLQTRPGWNTQVEAIQDVPEARWPDLAQRGQVWLVSRPSGPDDPSTRLAQFLDSRLYRVDTRTQGDSTVVRYAAGPAAPLPPATDLGGIAVSAGLGASSVRAGEGLPVLVEWKALRDAPPRAVMYLHLDGLDGHGYAGQDAEPDNGRVDSSTWKAGDTLLERRGLVVPPWVPPGRYQVTAGLYRRDNARVLPGANAQNITVGQVDVLPPQVPSGEVARFQGGPALLDARLLPDDPMRARRKPVATIDGTQTIVQPIDAVPGGTLRVLLAWRLDGPEPLQSFVHLLDSWGNRVAQADGPLLDLAPEDWKAGLVSGSLREIALPEQLPAGEYRLVAGVYRPDGTRLHLANGGDSVVIDTVTIPE